jgi:excisionase family DNA binding protein
MAEKLNERLALSIAEAVRASGVSRSTLYNLIEENKLRTIKVGARRLVPIASLNELLTPSNSVTQ